MLVMAVLWSSNFNRVVPAGAMQTIRLGGAVADELKQFRRRRFQPPWAPAPCRSFRLSAAFDMLSAPGPLQAAAELVHAEPCREL